MTRDEIKLEKQKLDSAVDEFAKEMKARLHEKVDEGFRGWDSLELDEHSVPFNMLYKAESIFNKLSRKQILPNKTMFDLSNYAMMIWYNIKSK